MKWNKVIIILFLLAFEKCFCAELTDLESKIFSQSKPLIAVKERLDRLFEKGKKSKLSQWEKLDYEQLRRAWKKGLIQLGLYEKWNALMNAQKHQPENDHSKK